MEKSAFWFCQIRTWGWTCGVSMWDGSLPAELQNRSVHAPSASSEAPALLESGYWPGDSDAANSTAADVQLQQRLLIRNIVITSDTTMNLHRRLNDTPLPVHNGELKHTTLQQMSAGVRLLPPPSTELPVGLFHWAVISGGHAELQRKSRLLCVWVEIPVNCLTEHR